MKWFLLIRISLVIGLALLLLFLWPHPAESQQEPLTATWRDSRVLVVSWHAAEPVRLYLMGGGRNDEWIERAGIVASGQIELPTGGVDQAEAPQYRQWIELRNANSQTVAHLAVPERPPEQWVVILPIVVK